MKYPEDELYELIQAINPHAIINRTTVKAIRSSLKRLPPTSPYKYIIDIESMPNGPYYGPEVIRYDKYDMTAYSQVHPLPLPIVGLRTSWDCIPYIYEYYGFRLRKEDLVWDLLSTGRGIRFTNQCILYEGTIRIGYAADIKLIDAILYNELDGFIQEMLDGQG